MKPEELARFSKKAWLIKYVDMPAKQLTIEISHRRGAQWYQLHSGRYLLCRDHGDHIVPGATRIPWPYMLPADYLLDEYPDWGNDSNAAIQLALEIKEQFGDPYRLMLETDEQGRRRWLAMFRKCHAYAWGDAPSEALCRAWLLAYEWFND